MSWRNYITSVAPVSRAGGQGSRREVAVETWSSRAVRRLAVCRGSVWAPLSRQAAPDLMEQPQTKVICFHQLEVFGATNWCKWGCE